MTYCATGHPRSPGRRFRMVAASALLVWGVPAAILAVQSPTVVAGIVLVRRVRVRRGRDSV